MYFCCKLYSITIQLSDCTHIHTHRHTYNAWF